METKELHKLNERAFNMPCMLFKTLQSFSSVVGPNGSGKSNVIDAMLFVFGRRAKQVSAILRPEGLGQRGKGPTAGSAWGLPSWHHATLGTGLKP